MAAKPPVPPSNRIIFPAIFDGYNHYGSKHAKKHWRGDFEGLADDKAKIESAKENLEGRGKKFGDYLLWPAGYAQNYEDIPRYAISVRTATGEVDTRFFWAWYDPLRKKTWFLQEDSSISSDLGPEEYQNRGSLEGLIGERTSKLHQAAESELSAAMKKQDHKKIEAMVDNGFPLKGEYLSNAIWYGSPETVKLLLQLGANPLNDENMLLWAAKQRDESDVHGKHQKKEDKAFEKIVSEGIDKARAAWEKGHAKREARAKAGEKARAERAARAEAREQAQAELLFAHPTRERRGGVTERNEPVTKKPPPPKKPTHKRYSV